MQFCNIVGHIVFISHVEIIVSVVAHEHKGVLPVTSILVVGVADGLIHHYLRLGSCSNRESSNGDVDGLDGWRTAFALAKKSYPTIIHIAVHLVEGVLAFVAEQIVVGIEFLAFGSIHSVIPNAIAEQQQIFRHIVLGGSFVVEHPHIAAVGIDIWGST